MEHHHFDQCIMILNSQVMDHILSGNLFKYSTYSILGISLNIHSTVLLQGNQILGNLSPDEYSRVIKVLEDAILSTDLAVYFRY